MKSQTEGKKIKLPKSVSKHIDEEMDFLDKMSGFNKLVGGKKEPSIYKSKVYKDFIRELSKPPKIKVIAQTEDDKEKAKLMQKLINYQFETNQNNILTKYFQILRMIQQEFIKSQVYGTKIRLDSIRSAIKNFTGLPKL